ncbi:peptidyl-prolyl cis-trans isomerase [Cardiosporidium cionae]|uniref:peptidylprolyl isomerase n=1 Tax=Cardiosporidium cionae TaxID=476202 RepID=A0ABQ7JG61_9APIC|nr:peptidyl-prolyl cis-trans isomerase [Cardiosporidium cionae]|eukprot:KAF8822996.1 peptidyl-prolyl cis-trans isomerase [Cardiosporidium cionae]
MPERTIRSSLVFGARGFCKCISGKSLLLLVCMCVIFLILGNKLIIPNMEDSMDAALTQENALLSEKVSAQQQREGSVIDLSGDGKVTKRILHSGEGKTPTTGELVSIHYIGTLTNGEVFDSSRNRNSPFAFVLGKGNVIKGFDLGVASMAVGEKSVLTIDSDYGYGASGQGNVIPPRSTLIFELELLSIEAVKVDKMQMTMEEKLQAASDEKELGNNCFKKNSLATAISHYTQALEYFENVEEWPQNLKHSKDTIALSCHLNLATCYLKSELFSKSIQQATAALEINSNSLKGYYRRGVARMNFGLLESALTDLKIAVKMEPKNADIRRDYATCKQRIVEEAAREKEQYTGMFGKIGLYSDKVGKRNLAKLKKVFLDISIDEAPPQRLVITLYNDTVPKTTDNFRALCTGERGVGKLGKPLHYKDSPFHRLIPGFMIQGGDFTNENGTGGESIYGPSFNDENFKDKHTKRGLLSMANAGGNTNSSQFFITFNECSHLDGKHVVFGEITEGLEFLDILERIETAEQDVPRKSTRIVECGEL